MSTFYGNKVTYEPINLRFATTTLTVTEVGNGGLSIFKTSGSNAWDAQAYSTDAFTAPCTIQFNKQADSGDNGLSYAMIGWNADPATDASYSSIDHASYPYQYSSYVVYNNGTGIGSLPAWDPTKTFYLVYDTDGYMRHYNGNTLLYSANYGTGQTVYFDSSFYIAGAYKYNGFSNIRIVKRSWNGSYYA